MNKKIQQIAEECGMVMYPTGLGISENTLWGNNIEKFAIRLVKECSLIAFRNSDEDCYANEAIKTAFGVE